MQITIVGALQAGRGWAMDLGFPSVFSEDVTMWMDADYHCWCPPGWQRMGDGPSLSLCIQCGCNNVDGCGLPSLVPSRLAEDGQRTF